MPSESNAMTNTNERLRHLSGEDFASLGLQHIAYVRPIPIDEVGALGYAIHAADGTRLAVLEDLKGAYAAILEHDMRPVGVH